MGCKTRNLFANKVNWTTQKIKDVIIIIIIIIIITIIIIIIILYSGVSLLNQQRFTTVNDKEN